MRECQFWLSCKPSSQESANEWKEVSFHMIIMIDGPSSSASSSFQASSPSYASYHSHPPTPHQTPHHSTALQSTPPHARLTQTSSQLGVGHNSPSPSNAISQALQQHHHHHQTEQQQHQQQHQQQQPAHQPGKSGYFISCLLYDLPLWSLRLESFGI